MKGKILVVDDQFGIRLLLSEVFKKEGYTVFQAANGFQALEIVKQDHPALVLLDMKIPGMNGIEILKGIKEINKQIKVILMTAYSELEMLNEAKENGAIHYFAKPFDINEVRRAVNKEMIHINIV
ncbi:MAG: response regulator [Bacillaceae bacterium]